MYHPFGLLRLHIIQLRHTTINSGDEDLPAGQVRAIPDDIGTKIEIVPNRAHDKLLAAAIIGVEAAARTLQAEGWRGPFYAEVPNDPQSTQKRIFVESGFVRNDQIPHRAGYVAVEYADRESN